MSDSWNRPLLGKCSFPSLVFHVLEGLNMLDDTRLLIISLFNKKGVVFYSFELFGVEWRDEKISKQGR